MNAFREENTYCYFHPRENVVGVCALCLHERLLVLASKQGHRSSSRRASYRAQNNVFHKKPPPNNSFSKMFDFTSFFNRLDHFRPWKSDNSGDHFDASTSAEDSFISIKFEENGLASWERNTESKVSVENCNKSWNHSTVIEHGKPRGSSFRWRKRIGHLFQLIRWKRSNKVSSKVEGIKVRKNWIRTLTKRRTME